MELLDVLEWLSAAPAELWLVPPVVMLTVIASLGLAQRRRQLDRLAAIAQRTGLELCPKSLFEAPEVRGEFRGRPLTMVSVSRPGARRRGRAWTSVTVEVKNPQLISMRLDRQDALDRVLIWAGMQDLQTGDETFDRRYIIKSHDAALVRLLFRDEAIRGGLIEADVQRVEMFTSQLCCYYGREEDDPSHAELLFNAVGDLADGIEGLPDSDDGPDRIG
ncbi:MAG: hypothetical protein IT307_05400 [Chloroflexi bacterium]|nr:hypothetical protein [Chloroflexota bacterium]